MDKIKIAIIGGSGICRPLIFENGREVKIKTAFGRPSGPVKIIRFCGKKAVFLARHGKGLCFPPHRINYLANMSALKKLGVRQIFAFNSTGSLKKQIRPGQFLIPSDYIDFDPPTFCEKNPKFVTPQISEKLRKILIAISKKIKLEFLPKGVYFNTKGPRFETKAEINLIKNFADVVGMTMAKEATLANELGLEYASLCSVDNYAHGISENLLTQEWVKKNQEGNKKFIEKIIAEILRKEL